MTPDDWQTAMHNEADAVSDAHWAHDTRRTARRWRWSRRLIGEFLAGQALLAALALLFLSPGGSPAEPGLWLALAAVGLSIAALRRGRSGWGAGAALLAWLALASTTGGEWLFGVVLPPALPVLVLTVAGLAALLCSPRTAVN